MVLMSHDACVSVCVGYVRIYLSFANRQSFMYSSFPQKPEREIAASHNVIYIYFT